MAVWPASLPPPELNSYHNSDTFPVIKTEMESGPPRRTRFSTHYMTRGQFKMTLDAAQMTDFQNIIDSSNLSADWLTGCPIDTGRGLADHRIRMTSVQRKVVKPPDLLWAVTVSFETDEHL